MTQRSVLDALEARYPMLRGTIRDQVTSSAGRSYGSSPAQRICRTNRRTLRCPMRWRRVRSLSCWLVRLRAVSFGDWGALSKQVVTNRTYWGAISATRRSCAAVRRRCRAQQYMRRERPDHTLQPTALVHETFLKLLRHQTIEWRGRATFWLWRVTSYRGFLSITRAGVVPESGQGIRQQVELEDGSRRAASPSGSVADAG